MKTNKNSDSPLPRAGKNKTTELEKLLWMKSENY